MNKKVIMSGKSINGVLTITYIIDGSKTTLTLQQSKPFERERSIHFG